MAMNDPKRLENYIRYANRRMSAADKQTLAQFGYMLALHVAYCHQKYGAVPLEESLAFVRDGLASDKQAEQLVDAMELLNVFLDASSELHQ